MLSHAHCILGQFPDALDLWCRLSCESQSCTTANKRPDADRMTDPGDLAMQPQRRRWTVASGKLSHAHGAPTSRAKLPTIWWWWWWLRNTLTLRLQAMMHGETVDLRRVPHLRRHGRSRKDGLRILSSRVPHPEGGLTGNPRPRHALPQG